MDAKSFRARRLLDGTPTVPKTRRVAISHRPLQHASTAGTLVAAMLSLLVACSVRSIRPPAATAIDPDDLAELWMEPRDLEERDLFYGVGGRALAPDPAAVFRFRAEKKGLRGFSPAYDVEDERGRTWNAKLGAESRPEVLASRIIWALGYHQPPTYYLANWKLERDGSESEQGNARFRPQLETLDRTGHWDWSDNPFLQTQAFRGLLVLMVFLNNWDLTLDNTAIYDLATEWEGVRRWYVVGDVGASISRNRGSVRQGTRGDIDGFQHQGFIRGVENGRVRFDWHGRDAYLLENLTTADVRWTCALLARLRPAQWDAALRAAGYAPEEAARLQASFDERIAQGMSLPETVPTPKA
jgi:hypothetical protein